MSEISCFDCVHAFIDSGEHGPSYLDDCTCIDVPGELIERTFEANEDRCNVLVEEMLPRKCGHYLTICDAHGHHWADVDGDSALNCLFCNATREVQTTNG